MAKVVRQEGRSEDWHQYGLSGMRWLLKRWWLWAGTGFMLVAVCVGYLVIPVPEGLISEATCNRIQLGTDLRNVVEMLGWRRPDRSADGPARGQMAWAWEDEDGNLISVTFEWDRPTVTAKSFVPTKLPFLALTRRRIERRIRALWP
jgi:hypothetical protein